MQKSEKLCLKHSFCFQFKLPPNRKAFSGTVPVDAVFVLHAHYRSSIRQELRLTTLGTEQQSCLEHDASGLMGPLVQQARYRSTTFQQRSPSSFVELARADRFHFLGQDQSTVAQQPKKLWPSVP